MALSGIKEIDVIGSRTKQNCGIQFKNKRFKWSFKKINWPDKPKRKKNVRLEIKSYRCQNLKNLGSWAKNLAIK